MIYTTDILDRETKDSYWLTVYATDRGVVPQFATVEVFIQVEDVNDNAPLTSEAMYQGAVPENSPEGVSVVQIQAQDPDNTSPTTDKLSYHIVSGNPQNLFTIDSHTGETCWCPQVFPCPPRSSEPGLVGTGTSSGNFV